MPAPQPDHVPGRRPGAGSAGLHRSGCRRHAAPSEQRCPRLQPAGRPRGPAHRRGGGGDRATTGARASLRGDDYRDVLRGGGSCARVRPAFGGGVVRSLPGKPRHGVRTGIALVRQRPPLTTPLRGLRWRCGCGPGGPHR